MSNMERQFFLREADRKIQKVLAILDGHFGTISGSDYFIILFFLLMRQEKLNNLLKTDSQFKISDRSIDYMEALGADKDRIAAWNEIFPFAEPILEKFQEGKVKEIEMVLSEIDQNVFDNDFQFFFNYVFILIGAYQNETEFQLMSEELIELIEKLVFEGLDEAKVPTIYNPFGGVGQLVRFKKTCRYKGMEEDNIKYFLGVMFVLVHDMDFSFSSQVFNGYNLSENLWINAPGYIWQEIYDEKSIAPFRNSLSEIEDCIVVSFPPVNPRLKARKEWQDRSLLKDGVKWLGENGKMILLLPNKFLYALGSEGNLKESLLMQDYVDMVVELPKQMVNVQTPVSLIVINKSKPNNRMGKVKFIDATSCVKRKPESGMFILEKCFDMEMFNQLLEATSSGDFVRYEENQTIIENDSNLVPSRYFLEGLEGVALRDFTIQLRGSSFPSEHKGRFVRVRDLADNYSNAYLDLESVDVSELPTGSRIVDESAFILSTRGNRLKLSYFEFKGEPIYVWPDAVTLKVDARKVNIDYLLNELFSNYVQEQYQALLTGDTLPFVTKGNLLSIRVKLPSIEEQEMLAKYLKEAINKVEIKLEKQVELDKRKDQRQLQEQASLWHSIGTPKRNVDSLINILSRYFEDDEKNINIVKASFSKKNGIELLEALRSIKSNFQSILSLLEKSESGLRLQDYPLRYMGILEILNFLDDYEKVNAARFNFKFSRNIHIDEALFNEGSNPSEQSDLGALMESTGLDRVGINTNEHLLKVLVDNIVENAMQHGFFQHNDKNEILINLIPLPHDNVFEINISNNGREFPVNFGKDKFIRPFITNSENGTGMGGYDINRIIEYFGGSWEFAHEINPDSLFDENFPVEFQIKLPLEIES